MVNQQDQAGGRAMWKVGIPRQVQVNDSVRGYGPGWQIPVTMADGSTFTVELPHSDFNADSVRAAIEDHVNRIVDVRGLEGPQLPF